MVSVQDPRRRVVWAVAVLVGLALLLTGTGQAAATQNGPVWLPGNTWSYRSISNPNVTQAWTVDRAAVVTVGTTNYSTWHVWFNTTTVSSSGTSTLTVHYWLTPDGLRLVKSEVTLPIFGTITATFSPPEPYVVFPLTTGATWSGSSTVTTTTIFGTTSATDSWSGQVASEGSLTVPAGTFTAAAARVPSTGAPYSMYYYSESAGWAVRVESYDNNGVLQDTMELTGYRYTPPLFGGLLGSILIWLVLLAAVAAAFLLAVFLLLRRRPRMAQPIPPPMQPPQMPPQPPTGPEGPPPGPP